MIIEIIGAAPLNEYYEFFKENSITTSDVDFDYAPLYGTNQNVFSVSFKDKKHAFHFRMRFGGNVKQETDICFYHEFFITDDQTAALDYAEEKGFIIHEQTDDFVLSNNNLLTETGRFVDAGDISNASQFQSKFDLETYNGWAVLQ